MRNTSIYIALIAATIFAFMYGLGRLSEYSVNSQLAQPADVSFVDVIMSKAVAFESDGNLALREAVKAKLAKSPRLTLGDYRELKRFADKIELDAMTDMFKRDLYKYRSNGGLTVNLPEGYIEKKETK